MKLNIPVYVEAVGPGLADAWLERAGVRVPLMLAPDASAFADKARAVEAAIQPIAEKVAAIEAHVPDMRRQRVISRAAEVAESLAQSPEARDAPLPLSEAEMAELRRSAPSQAEIERLRRDLPV